MRKYKVEVHRSSSTHIFLFFFFFKNTQHSIAKQTSRFIPKHPQKKWTTSALLAGATPRTLFVFFVILPRPPSSTMHRSYGRCVCACGDVTSMKNVHTSRVFRIHFESKTWWEAVENIFVCHAPDQSNDPVVIEQSRFLEKIFATLQKLPAHSAPSCQISQNLTVPA